MKTLKESKVGDTVRVETVRGYELSIRKAGTIILLSTIVIWFTTYFGFTPEGFQMLAEEEMEQSLLAAVGSAIAWIFTPLGWGNWQSAVAFITGLVAKENIVGTMRILYPGGWPEIGANFGKAAGYSFLVFSLLCATCFAAIGAIRREMDVVCDRLPMRVSLRSGTDGLPDRFGIYRKSECDRAVMSCSDLKWRGYIFSSPHNFPE